MRAVGSLAAYDGLQSAVQRAFFIPPTWVARIVVVWDGAVGSLPRYGGSGELACWIGEFVLKSVLKIEQCISHIDYHGRGPLVWSFGGMVQ